MKPLSVFIFFELILSVLLGCFTFWAVAGASGDYSFLLGIEPLLIIGLVISVVTARVSARTDGVSYSLRKIAWLVPFIIVLVLTYTLVTSYVGLNGNF